MRQSLLLLSSLLLLASPVVVLSETDAAVEEAGFIRLVEAKDGTPQALQVAVARMARRDGVVVDLVSAVHMADEAYFEAVDQRLSDYETVLFELVGDPAETREPPPESSALSLIGAFQGGMTGALGLAFQLEHIDYERENMVHADLTQEEFTDSMRDRDESMLQLFFRAWALGGTVAGRRIAAQQQADLFSVLLADDRELALKRMMARQLSQEDILKTLLSGPDGSTLIEVRNGRALDVLEEQLGAGGKAFAIFYGAGHMADFEERLIKNHGFERRSTEWLTAWDMRGE